MMKPLGSFFLVAAVGLFALTAPHASAQLDFLRSLGGLDIQGASNTDINTEKQIATYTGDLRIVFDDTIIKAGRAEYYVKTGEMIASENVTVYQDGQVFKGEKVVYNTQSGTISSEGLRSRVDSILFRADNFRTKTKDAKVIEGGETTFSTHDAQVPNWRIKAKSIQIYPDDKVVFKSPKIYAGNTPIFWLPHLAQPLDDELGYFFTPGYNTRWGAFLLNRYGAMHGDHTLGQYHFDVRHGRGVGLGADFISQKFRENPNIGKLTLYSTYDLDPQFHRESPERDELSQNRYRINFQHRIYFPGPEESTFYLDFDINRVSDRLYYSDFFFSDAQLDPEPDNLINLVKREENYTVSLSARFQLNDFFERDARTPEVSFDAVTQKIGNTNFYYRGSSSYGILSKERSTRQIQQLELQQAQGFTDLNNALAGTPSSPNTPEQIQNFINSLQGQIDGTGFNRLYTYHEALFPADLGPIRVVPRAGIGMVSYTDIEGGVNPVNQARRPIVHVGLDASTKWTKEYKNIQSRRLGLDRMRHIVQPYLNYSYVETDEIGGVIDRIDGNIATTKLRPIDIPLFSNIDAIDPWNIFRPGIRHTFQTRRGKKTHNWLTLNSYMDVYMDDPEFDRDISGLHTNLRWAPVPWLSLKVDSQIPIDNNPANFNELNSQLIWAPTDRVQLGLSHFLLNDHPTFNDSSLVSLTSYIRLSENWGFSTTHRYEAEDSILEMQSYNLHRDLTTWTASIGALMLNNIGTEDEIGVVFSFTLKEFPSVYVPVDLNPNPTYR